MEQAQVIKVVSELITFINPNKGKRKKVKINPIINPIICICNNDSERK